MGASNRFGVMSTGHGSVRIRDVKGTGGRYRVSDRGDVFTVKDGIAFLMSRVGDKGRYVNLYRNGAMAKVKVAYLVAREFLPNPLGRAFVCHKDGNVGNCDVGNLYWSEERDAPFSGRTVIRFNAVDGTNPVTYTGGVPQAAEELGLAKSAIYACLSGRSRTAGGYMFIYKE